ncbi:MAG: protein kinase [Myxococcaceae bacterium]|nr:protein kinase [Myxococcaceae bacterium]
MAVAVQCPTCGTVSASGQGACASCGASLSVGEGRAPARKSTSGVPAARGKGVLPSTGRRTGEVRPARTVDDSAAGTAPGDDPAQTTAEEGPPRVGPTPLEVPVASGQDGGGRRSNGGLKALPRPAASPPLVVSSSRDQLVGQKLQEYVIKGRIGVGGMGVVYKAVHSLIGKEVAIKVLRGDVVTDARDVDRMLDEARIINDIKHRGIINIFGAGTLDDGRHYLIMELLEGESLEQLMLRVGTVAAGDSVLILEETLSALAAAHAAGVVHRDLKPANVFLVKEGNKVYVKLLDFGLARRQQQNVTRIAGTPDYISPEHARGRPAGPPADLYAFGVMCFHMLTGRLPFSGSTPMEVMEKHVRDEPPVPHEVNPAIPKALSELILRLLEKDPAARPDANQVKADLRAATKQLRNAATMMSLMSVAPVAEVSPGKAAPDDVRARELAVKAQVEDVKRQVKKRWPLVVGGLVGVWLVGVLVYVLWPSEPPPAKPVVKRLVVPTERPPEVATRPGVEVGERPSANPGPGAAEPKPVERSPETGPSVEVGVDAGAPVALGVGGGAAVEPNVGEGVDREPTGDPGTVDPEVACITLSQFKTNDEVDDACIGTYKRHVSQGQSIESMLARMEGDMKEKGYAKQRSYYAGTFNEVKRLCDVAKRKRELVDCGDKVLELHDDFYKSLK